MPPRSRCSKGCVMNPECTPAAVRFLGRQFCPGFIIFRFLSCIKFSKKPQRVYTGKD